MKQNSKKQVLFQGILFGSLWGIIEATLGYVIHLFPAFFSGLSGAILFPIGFYLMLKGYEKSKDPSAILYMGLTAGLIKLSNFILPYLHPGLVLPMVKIFSPALFIVIEGTCVWFVIKIMASGEIRKLNLLHAFAASFSWRALFVGYQYILFYANISKSFVKAGSANMVRFIVVETLVNAILLFGIQLLVKMGMKKEDSSGTGDFQPMKLSSQFLSLGLFIAGIAVNLLFQLI